WLAAGLSPAGPCLCPPSGRQLPVGPDPPARRPGPVPMPGQQSEGTGRSVSLAGRAAGTLLRAPSRGTASSYILLAPPSRQAKDAGSAENTSAGQKTAARSPEFAPLAGTLGHVRKMSPVLFRSMPISRNK